MHIDWFIFFAQIFNFLILLWLLKKFLYGRILNAIDTRESKLNASFEEAEKSREEARQAASIQEERLKELAVRSEELLNRARVEAEKYRAELMQKAREEVDQVQNRWIETLRSERDNFFQELRRLAASQVYAISRRVLKDLADVDLEERIVQVLAERIEGMEPAEREKLKAMAGSHEGVAIHAAHDIPPSAQERLHKIIQTSIGSEVSVTYRKSDDVMSGYELRMNGYKIAWSMKDYIDTMEETFYRVMYEESQDQKQVH